MSNCTECGGKSVESGDILVLADGYEIPVKKCKDCGKELMV
ncbi:MAG: hypothetical protein ACQEXX_19865 [Bacillota bacterium]